MTCWQQRAFARFVFHRPRHSASANVTFSGTLNEPPPCTIDAGNKIEVDFGMWGQAGRWGEISPGGGLHHQLWRRHAPVGTQVEVNGNLTRRSTARHCRPVHLTWVFGYSKTTCRFDSIRHWTSPCLPRRYWKSCRSNSPV